MRRLAAVVVIAGVLAGCRQSGPQAPPATSRPDILLVTIDTWRADRLRPNLTPALSALAASGTTFTAARSAVPLTLPSHTTILTGLLPPIHGVRENGMTLGDSHATIARLLKDTGYRTAAFVGAFVLDRRFGLARGFDVYDDRIPRDPNASEKLEAERPASAVVNAALEWLEPRPAAPLFLWLHFYDPHAPYVGSYDAEVSRVDTELARVFKRLSKDNTIIIVAGDHGEGLGEHGERTHGMLLYDSTLRVPLFVAGPGVKAGTESGAVSLADIAPTILGIAGAAPLHEMTGRDLLSGTGGNSGTDRDSDIYAETEYPRVAGWSPLQALADGRWKAIRAGAQTELYDLQNDASESKNLAAAQPSTVAAMAARANAIHASGGKPAATAVSAEAQERLRALGYVASSAPPAAVAANALNPADSIGAWNAFEDALGALHGSASAALPALKQLATANPDAPVFQTTYARAVKDSGHAADALALYRAAAKRWPSDATLLHDLAVAAREAGRLDEAIKADQAAVALDPQSPTARNGLGMLAIDRGHNPDAVREFTEATRLDPNNASYWTNLGNAQRTIGEAAAAEQAYRTALRLDPRSADAANGLGVLLVEAKRPAEAVQWFERARAAAPDFVEAQLNLGIALQQSGDPKRAADVYRTVLASPGNHPREKQAARDLLASLGATR